MVEDPKTAAEWKEWWKETEGQWNTKANAWVHIPDLIEHIKDLETFLKSAFDMIHNDDMMHIIEHDTSDLCPIPWCVGARNLIEGKER